MLIDKCWNLLYVVVCEGTAVRVRVLGNGMDRRCILGGCIRLSIHFSGFPASTLHYGPQESPRLEPYVIVVAADL